MYLEKVVPIQYCFIMAQLLCGKKMHISILVVERAKEQIICTIISILGSSYIGLISKDV